MQKHYYNHLLCMYLQKLPYICSNLRLWRPLLNSWPGGIVWLNQILASPGVAGDLRDEWALPGVTVAPASFPCCPTPICLFLSSYLSIQCNLTQGAVPLLLNSPPCRTPSLVFSDVNVKRDWPAWVEHELSWHSWYSIIGDAVSDSCHPQLSTLWLVWYQGQQESGR